MPREIIFTEDAPRPAAHYSQAVRSNGFVFVAGQGGVLPGPELRVAGETVAAQTTQALKNIAAILAAAGSNLAHVVSVTVILADMDDFAEMNAAYAPFFPDNPPARAAYAARALPFNTLVEIIAVAAMPE